MSNDTRRSFPNGQGHPSSRRDSVYYDEEIDDKEYIRTSKPRIRSRSRHRELSVEDRRSSRGGFEEDRLYEKIVYDDEPRVPARSRAPIVEERPRIIRRQSSFDTFFEKKERYGPPALRDNYHNDYPPVPRVEPPSPPRRYVERVYEDDYRAYPERVREREREIVLSRRRSRSRSSSSSSSSRSVHIRTKPKRGKTRIPVKLVSVKAIIDLGYPYEMEGETIIIRKALAKEHIDEVMKLSETYKSMERVEMSGGRSGISETIEESRKEIVVIEPPTYRPRDEHVERLTFERRDVSPPRNHISRSRSVGRAPLIVEAKHEREYRDRSNKIPIGPLVLLQPEHRGHKAAKEVEIVKREEVDDDVQLYRHGEYLQPDVVLRIERNHKKGPNPRAVRAMMQTLM